MAFTTVASTPDAVAAPVNQERNPTPYSMVGCVIARTAVEAAPVEQEHNPTPYSMVGCVIA